METTEQILERQYAHFSFRNGKVEYFSISTQHDAANTIIEAIQNILDADAKYNGKSPLAYVANMQFLTTNHVSDEEFAKAIDTWNSLGMIYSFPLEKIEHIEFIENKNE